MKLTERLELIRAGYKRKEIDAMILAENEERIEDTSHEITPKTDEEEKAVEIKEENRPPLPDQMEKEKEDFEKLYNDALNIIKEKDAMIKRIQETNVQMDLSGGVRDIEKEAEESLNALLS